MAPNPAAVVAVVVVVVVVVYIVVWFEEHVLLIEDICSVKYCKSCSNKVEMPSRTAFNWIMVLYEEQPGSSCYHFKLQAMMNHLVFTII